MAKDFWKRGDEMIRTVIDSMNDIQRSTLFHILSTESVDKDDAYALEAWLEHDGGWSVVSMILAAK